MSKVILFTSVTVDGVMQAPGRPDEDRRGGFQYGGWAVPYADSVLGSIAGQSMATSGALLLGRRTYEDFYAVWPNRPKPNPFTDVLNNTMKYVASTTLKEPLPWMKFHAAARRRRNGRGQAKRPVWEGPRGPRQRRAGAIADAA
jgi:dihydrofolate reductase